MCVFERDIVCAREIERGRKREREKDGEREFVVV